MKRMHLKYGFVVLLLIIVLSSAAATWMGAAGDPQHPAPNAQRAELDLSGWNFERDGIVRLSGEWAWTWGQLLSPQELASAPSPPQYVQLPASWTQRGEGSPAYPASGFATYHLHVHWKNAPRLLALRTQSIASSCRIWVDGILLGGMGQVGTNPASYVAQDAPGTFVFPTRSDGADIVIQVANFEHRRGGLWEMVELGTPDRIESKHEMLLAFDLVLFGTMFMMGVYHFILYAMRRQDRAMLIFGGFCLLIAMRTLVVGDVFFHDVLPQVSWEARLRIEYFCSYLALPCFALFVRELFPHETSRLAVRLLVAVGVMYTAVTAASPAFIFIRLVPSFDVVVVAGCAYLLAVLVRAALRGRQGAMLAAAGAFIFVVFIVNDILYFNELAQTGSYSPLGMFVFVMLYAAVLSMKFSRALTAEERMSYRLAEQAQEVQMLNERLQELNRGLEAGIAERMNELRQTNEHLAQQAAEIARMDGARRQLLSNISHELRTPMTSIRGYVEAMLDNVIESSSEQRHYLRLILNKMIGLNRLISDLFELSKLESGHPDLQFRSLPVGVFLERTREKYELDVVGSGLRFEWEDVEIAVLPDKTSVVLDTERIDQVLTNLIANAARSTPPEGMVRIRFLTQWGQRGGEPEPVRELVVQVEDTGVGIDEGDLPFIFERFYKGNDSASGGTGLGLAIAKEIVAHHGGKLWVESRKGLGSTFGFTLLLYEEAVAEGDEGEKL